MICYLSLSVIFLIQIVMFFNRVAIIRFFTNDAEVQEIAISCIPIIIIMYIPDGFQGVM